MDLHNARLHCGLAEHKGAFGYGGINHPTLRTRDLLVSLLLCVPGWRPSTYLCAFLLILASLHLSTHLSAFLLDYLHFCKFGMCLLTRHPLLLTNLHYQVD